ncbi:MAG: hypothetical protein ACI8XB_002461 [Patiriisocius sp.]|jgi:hypothetical protein
MSSLQGYTELKTARYERKFPIDDRSLKSAEILIKNHPKLFKEIYHRRSINNIYFDTPGMDFYLDNQDGKKERKKVRIRWYGDLNGKIEKPILEIKIKNGLAGTKMSFALPAFNITPSLDIASIENSICNANLPENVLMLLDSLKPTLINSYKRKYYQDFTKNYRITLDSDMTYYNVYKNLGSIKSMVNHGDRMVLELKYNIERDSQASNYSSYFPFRMNKHSKYVNGIEEYYSVRH